MVREDRKQGAPLRPLLDALADIPQVAQPPGRQRAVAVAGAAQPYVVASLALRGTGEPLVVVTATTDEAEQLAEDLRCFVPESTDSTDSAYSAYSTESTEPHRTPVPAGHQAAQLSAGPVVGDVGTAVMLLPAWDTLPFERVSPEVHTMGLRLAVLWHLLGDGAGRPQVVVAPVRAVLQALGPWKEVAPPIIVTPGQHLDASELIERLVAAGYRREHQVEHRGELAVRGGIIDVFPSTAELPVRIDLWGDDVDRLTVFDVADQRSIADASRLVAFGCREVVPTTAFKARAEALADEAPWARPVWERLCAGELFEGMESWLPWLQDDEELLTDHLPGGSQVALVEPRRVRDRALELYDEEGALAHALASTWGWDSTAAVPRLHAAFTRLLARSSSDVITLSSVPEGPEVPTVEVGGFTRPAGDPARLADQVRSLLDDDCSVTLCASSLETARRFSEALEGQAIEAPVLPRARAGRGVGVTVAALHRGFVVQSARVAVMAEPDITGRRMPHRRARPQARPVDGFFDDLGPGGFVVHRQHGVARYAGMTTRSIGDTVRDYLVLEFRGKDRLYLPVDQIDVLTPYSGGETPTLSRMGGAEWQRARGRARAAAAEVAQELVGLYRRRLEVTGHAFAPDTPWQRQLEDSFAYVETTDQRQAIADVKGDMEQPRPMDRLVCGDVGFGKTEVALRAMFKAVQDGRQAAVLVPTTLLASQHHQTFTARLASFGAVRVEMLSRFLTSAQQQHVVRALADGSVDIVVGTHRLLGSDVRFKDLGLLVIDEEQRFGVAHKEAIKQLSAGVDVLTLTANPIPRTLEMALTGIRDLSLISTPPADRRPILTYVGEYDEAAVSEALRRELLREGQVFFVHNRVVDIDAVADRLRALVPNARVAVAHGQMDEGSLEKVAMDFWEHQYDVLVCTTIIESGIDMPTVNTLVVDRADLLGLGQLHQIRGRVGRGDQRAYAYLFHPRDRALTEEAYERLKTIGENTELGSGFKIAMRDLEIRGAGNILGSDQSGHIAAVGYDLYVQLVAEAVAEARGERKQGPPPVSLDVPGDAHLPPAYVPGEDTRVEAYRRLAAATSVGDVDDIALEWQDRFGRLPAPAQGLLALARLRAECLRLGVTDVVARPTPGVATLRPMAKMSPVVLPPSAQARLHRLAPEARYREDLRQLLFPLHHERLAAEELTDVLAALLPAAREPTPSADSMPHR